MAFLKPARIFGMSELGFLRISRLRATNDAVIIKLNKGSYVPAIAYNRDLPLTSKVDPYCERLILRAKTAVDTRKVSKLSDLADYFERLEAADSRHPRVQANLAFLRYAVAPLFPRATLSGTKVTAKTVEKVRAEGFEPWELTFADACLHASNLHQWHKSLGLFQTAVANSQGEAAHFWWYTALLAAVGSVDHAIEIVDSAVRHFARTSVAARLDLAMLQIIGKRYGDAEETLTSLSEYGGEVWAVAGYFLILYEAQDKIDEALAVGQAMDAIVSGVTKEASAQFVANCGYNVLFLGMYSLVLGRAGYPQRACNIIDLIFSLRDSSRYFPALDAAIGCLGLGDSDPANAVKASVLALEAAAFDENDPLTMWFHIFPPLRHLNAEPSFQSLLKRLNLPPQHIR